MARRSLQKHLGTITQHAISFADHWIDDDTPEEQAAAEKAREEIYAADTAMMAALTAARAMRATLETLADTLGMVESYGFKEECREIRARIDQAKRAGIPLP